VVANRRLKRGLAFLRKALFGSDGIETRHRLRRVKVDKLGESQAGDRALRCRGVDWGRSPTAIAVPQRPVQGAKVLALCRRCFRAPGRRTAGVTGRAAIATIAACRIGRREARRR
jgi:hypothetical protein